MSVWQYLALGYLLVILVGSLLLVLPFASREGGTSYLDALFTSTSATCVTGLIVFDTAVHWTVFGQVVILLLIQTGGLGFSTFVTVLFMMLRRGALGVYEKRTIMQTFGGNRLAGAGKLILRVVVGAVAMEAAGAFLLMIRFVPQFGGKGVYFAVFHAVSAFCNAGFDLFGSAGAEFVSLSAYATDPLVSLVVPALIILGGLGFCVWGDIIDCRFRVKKFQFYTKFVLLVNSLLIAISTALFLVFERNNANYADYHFGQKLLCSFFNATTTRTAGFAATDFATFSESGYLLSVVLMFIGGSPAGTAGGVKTVTIVMLIASMLANIKGKKDVTVMNRKIADETIRRCVAIVTFSFSVLVVLTIALLAVQRSGFLDTLYEMTSAIATVGLSRGLTGALYPAGKLIVALTMYLGRIGPITLALVFNSHTPSDSVSYADGKVIIG